MPFDLDLSPASQLLTAVKQTFTPAVADDILLAVGRRVGVKAEELISPYPPVSGKALPLFYTRVSSPRWVYKKINGRYQKTGKVQKGGEPHYYQSKFKNTRQQHKVMARAAEGSIPYRRSGTLGKSITSDAAVYAPGVVTVRIGSRLAYAIYVIDEHFQSHYHRGNWTPLQQDIQRGLPQLTKVAVNGVMREVEKRLHG